MSPRRGFDQEAFLRELGTIRELRSAAEGTPSTKLAETRDAALADRLADQLMELAADQARSAPRYTAKEAMSRDILLTAATEGLLVLRRRLMPS